MDLAGRIRTEREARQMSQEALARQAGMSLRALNSLERGEAVNPHYATLAGIADAFGMSISELLEEPAPLGEAPLLDDPLIVEWLREHGATRGAMSDREFLEYGRGLDSEELDEDGNPTAVVKAAQAVGREADATRRLLWTPKEYVSLRALLPVEPGVPVAEQKRRRREQLGKLRREMEKRYHRRGLALWNYAELLAEQGSRAAERERLLEQAWRRAA